MLSQTHMLKHLRILCALVFDEICSCHNSRASKERGAHRGEHRKKGAHTRKVALPVVSYQLLNITNALDVWYFACEDTRTWRRDPHVLRQRIPYAHTHIHTHTRTRHKPPCKNTAHTLCGSAGLSQPSAMCCWENPYAVIQSDVCTAMH